MHKPATAGQSWPVVTFDLLHRAILQEEEKTSMPGKHIYIFVMQKKKMMIFIKKKWKKSDFNVKLEMVV